MTTATEVGYLEMRIAKVVEIREAEDEPFHQYVVLEEVAGDRHLAIEIGHPEPSAWRVAWVESPGGVR